MKKKLFIPILVTSLLVIAVTGYFLLVKKNTPQNEKQSITTSEDQKEPTSEETFTSYSSGFEITNLKSTVHSLCR